ncbi:hypothetical protein ACPW96_22415 [Micromonospora sp. DT81.3]|uniref:hypothetical protein n=1 Tax=Actinomycetes TaxID=1760 RepID=UPI003CFB4484
MSLTVVQAFRFCHKCNTLFYEGRHEPAGTPKGLCPAGGSHEPMGFQFEIPARATPSSTAQDRWRFCGTCWAMYFDGFPQKGVCPGSGRGHTRETRFRHNFALPHDVPETPTAQRQWRFCSKCNVMFYDGFEGKGRCTAGNGHVAQGHDFVLPHLRP